MKQGIRSLRSLLLLVAYIAMLPSESFADNTIYFVDMQRVVMESARGKAARANFEADAKKQKAEFEKQQAAVRAMHESLKKQATVLSKSALQAKQEEIRREDQKLRQAISKKMQELARRNNSLVEQIANETQNVIKKLCKEEGYRFVLERGQHLIVYAEERLDLTDKVIKLLDQRR